MNMTNGVEMFANNTLRALIGQSQEGIKIIAADGHLQFMSASGLSALEIPEFSQIAGQNWSSLWPAASRPLVEAALTRARAGKSGRFQGFRPTRAGAPRWWDVSVSPIFDESGAVTQILANSRDISCQYQDEGRVEVVQALVRQLTEERTRLSKARQDMDHSERLRLLGQFVGGIIHDLNNVLAALQSASILLRRRVHGEIATEILNHVDDAVSRGAQLTRQLLDFSRQDADVAKVLDLRELIMRDAELLRHLVGCDIAIGFEFADDVPPVLAPPSRVRSVLFNLIANSRDAIDHSGQYPERIVIRVSSRMLFARQGGLAAGSYAVVEIEDNGAGMTPEVLARLGQAFFTTKASGKGTGLGIPSAFELARMCGGDVELESEVGKGTLIRLVLGASPTREHTHAKLELCLDATLNGKATVLVIEHDELLREHVVGSLQGLGYTVLEAAGACAAVAQMMTAPHVDIVVCDLDRDDDGQEIATRLRDRFPELPIIFLSATGRGIPGGEIFLSKPVDEDMLARVILEQLGRLPARLLTNRLLKRSERLLPNPAGLDL